MSSSTKSKVDAAASRLPRLDGTVITDLLWLQTSFIGDMILNTAAMAAAQATWPDVRQSVITTAAGMAIYQDLEFIDRTFLFTKRKGSSYQSFRATSGAIRDWRKTLPPDRHPLILQAHKSFRSSIVTRMTGLPVVTYRETARLPLFGKRDVTLVDRVMPLHETARIGMLLEPLGMSREKIVAAKPTLTPAHAVHSDPQTDSATQYDGGEILIALAPGSIWGTKRWLPERFAKLAVDLLAKVPHSRIILTGSVDEVPLCAAIERKISDRSRVTNLAGKTALKDLPQLFSGFDLIVSNDSSPVHYGSAVNVPVVAIFGATIPQFGFAPVADRSLVIEAGPLDCRPCSDHGPQVCPAGHFKCMRDIQVEHVLDACLGVLQKGR